MDLENKEEIVAEETKVETVETTEEAQFFRAQEFVYKFLRLIVYFLN